MVIDRNSEIKGYKILERIGTGGFGAVYRANQPTVGREVAIKVILPGLANQPEFIRRFETEAQLIAKLEHLHIVPLYDYWRDPDGAYLVMRLLKGGSVQDALQHGPFKLEDAVLLLDQVASALSAMHRYNIIHRDIKPSNILLDEDGNAYLTDFGVAKELVIPSATKTNPESIIGSPEYISPEQVRNEKLTPQTDIYSLGVLTYEIVAGEHPFPSTNTIEIIYKHINETLPKLQGFEPDIADGINDVIQKATKKNPAHRYQDAMKMARAFREAAKLSVSQAPINLVELLTPREQEVLKGITDGKTNRQIAEELVIEVSTVKWYIKQIYRKLNVRSRVQAIVKAREMNLIVDEMERDDSVVVTTSELPEPKNPYKGLLSFDIQDEKDFFGREKLVEKLLEKMKDSRKYSRFLVVVGPSGSGKSSLVKAGLIPKIWRGELPNSDKWFIVDITPGSRPFDELEVALTRIAAEHGAWIGEHLNRDQNGLLRVADLILPRDQSELVIVIDQFEEVFTLVEEEETRQQFLDLLTAAVNDDKSRVRVVVTLRADFYDRPLHYTNFGEMMRSRLETVLPLSAEELERAIVRPANQAGVSFDDGLVPAIIDDVLYQPGGLPLLQYALTELFELRKGHILTRESYQQIGGVVGALGMRAEELYQELAETDRAQIRQIFLRLVTLGEGTNDTRRIVPLSELLDVADDPDTLDETIETFTNYRLLSMDTDPESGVPTVQVAHEALLREWERLREWLNESRMDIRLQRQLARATRNWEQADKDESFLLRGARLEQFDSWRQQTDLTLTKNEQDFLQASIYLKVAKAAAEKAQKEKETRLEKRARSVLQALAGVMLIATLVSTIFAVRANNFSQEAQASANARATQVAIAEENADLANAEAEARAEAEAIAIQEREQALYQAAIGLAGQVQKEINGDFPQRAVPLALEAVENYPYTWQVQRALGDAVINHSLEMIIPHEGEILLMDLTEDGTKLMTSIDTGKIQIFDAATGKLLKVMEKGKPSYAIFSPNESLILSTDFFQERIQVWDAASAELKFNISPESPISTSLINNWSPWSPDSKYFVTGHEDGTARIWNALTGEEVQILRGHATGLSDAAWAPGGSRIVTDTGEFDNKVILWDAFTGEALTGLPETEWNTRFGSWSRDGEQFTLRGWDSSMLLDSETGDLVYTFNTPNWTQDAEISPDGKHIITPGFQDGIVRLWDTETGELLMTTKLSRGQPISWSPSGRMVALPGLKKLNIWDVSSGSSVANLSTPFVPRFVQWSPDEILVYARTNPTEVWVYRLTRAVQTIQGPSGFSGFTGLPAWSPNSTQVARGYPDGSVKIWDLNTGEEVSDLRSNLSAFPGLVDWSPTGEEIMLVIYNETIPELNGVAIWDTNTGELKLEYHSPYGSIIQSEWSPDGSKIVSTNNSLHEAYGSDQAHITVWDVSTGKEIWTVPFDVNSIFGAAWSPDGRLIAAGPTGQQMVILDADNGDEVMLLLPEGFSDSIFTPSFSPDGRKIAVCAGDMIWIYDVSTGELLISFAGFATTIDWSIDGEHILANDGVSGVRIYEVATGTELMVYEIEEGIDAKLSPDNTKVLISSQNGDLIIYPIWLELDDLVSYAKECCMIYQMTEEERKLFGLPPVSDN